MENKFYVYCHQRLTDGKCFYIGKGTGKRAEDTNNRNKYWHNVVAKHGFKAVILVNNISEDKAFELEKEFIRQIGRENLVNLTDGGEGSSGFAPSEETRQKMSEAMRGEKHPNFGKKHSAETLQKMAEAKKGKQHSAETLQKMAEAKKGKRHSEASRQKISEAMRGEKHPNFGKKHSAEARQKMSEAQPKKPVFQFTKNGQFIAKFNSIVEAAHVTEINRGNISLCCQGKIKSAGGYVWQFVEN